MVKVSIVVPIYNVEKYLEKCLQSLVTQTFEDIEIICVNDGSTDNSKNIIKQFLKNYPSKIVHIDKKNGGLGDARNAGIERARGEYIAFIDSDDWVEPNMIQSMYQNAKDNNSDIVCCGLRRIDENGKLLSQEQINLKDEYSPKEALITLAPAAWNKLYKTKLFLENDVRYSVGVWYEDLPTTAKLFMQCNKITTVNEIFVNYLQRKGSISYSYDERSRDIFIVLADIKKFNESKCMNKYYDEIEYLYIIHIIFAHLFRSSVLSIKRLNKEVKYSINILENNFPNWKKNKYIKLTGTMTMNLINKIGILSGILFCKFKCYTLFLLIYKIVNKLIPIQNKW